MASVSRFILVVFSYVFIIFLCYYQLYIIHKFKDTVTNVLTKSLQSPGALLQVNIGQVCRQRCLAGYSPQGLKESDKTEPPSIAHFGAGVQAVLNPLKSIVIQTTAFYCVHKMTSRKILLNIFQKASLGHG